LYEEAFTLIGTLTSERISPDAWKMFEVMYQVFEHSGADYFVDMMAAFYHYITVDVEALLANNDHVLAFYNMSKKVSTSCAVLGSRNG
jgi:hypothetical protein